MARPIQSSDLEDAYQGAAVATRTTSLDAVLAGDPRVQVVVRAAGGE